MIQTTFATDSNERDYEFKNFNIRKIPNKPARRFIKEHHYAKGMGNAAMCWGLYNKPTMELLGVIAFHTPISENVRKKVFEIQAISEDDEPGLYKLFNRCHCKHIDKAHMFRDHVTELHRMAIKDKAPHNTGTWFISRALDALKDYKPKYWAVVSFADSTEGHDGTVYQAASADYYGSSGARMSFIDQNGQLRPQRQCGKNISKQEAKKRGWEVVKREHKHRYVFWLPDPYQNKEQLRQKSQLPIQNYPQ